MKYSENAAGSSATSADAMLRSYKFGDFRLDCLSQELHCIADGRTIQLNARAFDTLKVLLEHAGEVLDKQTLMNRIWPHTVVEENNLDQQISALRQALGEQQGQHRYIVTVRGRGYRFVAPVQVASSEQHDRPVRRARIVLAAIAVVAVVVTALLVLLPRNEVEPPGASLAVLPFRSLGGTEVVESLGLGMADTLIAGISAYDLEVRPLSAVRRYMDPEQDAIQAGRDLGVAAVLEGYIQRDEAALRVSARLLNVADGRQIWAQSYEEPFTGIFSVQDAIAERVSAALLPELSAIGFPGLKRYTDDSEAYLLYVYGRYHRLRGNEGGLRQAIAYFRQAIDQDPNFALAYVGLAEAHSILGVFGIAAPRDAFPIAREAIDKAIALAPDIGEAYASLGHIKMQYERDWTGAEQAFARAIDLNPNYAPARQWRGIFLAYRGQFDAGLGELRAALTLEPSPAYSALIGMLLNYQRRYDDAITQLETTLAMDPGYAPTYTYLGVAYLRRGDYTRALEYFSHNKSPTPGSAAYVGQVYALSGRRDEALQEIERLVSLSQERYVSAYDIATIYAAVGDADQAFLWLERAVEDASPLLGWLPWDPVFDGMRSDPRYANLLTLLDIN